MTATPGARLKPRHTLTSLFGRVTTSGSYVPQIDGLRLLAILPVLLWHISLRVKRFDPAAAYTARDIFRLVPNGHVGVLLFFFISGYIISYPFVIGRPPTARRFYARRLTRIEPPYIIALLICFIPLGLAHYTPEDATSFHRVNVPLWKSLLASMVYLHGFLFQSPSRIDPPAWSLEIEAQFYLLSPVLLWAYMRFASPLLRRASLLLLGLLFIVVTQWLNGGPAGLDGWQGWTLIAYAYPFFGGIVASDWAARSRPFEQPPRIGYDVAFVLGLFFLAASNVVDRIEPTLLERIANDLMRALSILGIYLGACRGRFARPFLGWAPIALIGGMVYSIYLTHVPVVQALANPVLKPLWGLGLFPMWALSFMILSAAVLVVAAAFFLLVEKPFMDPAWPARMLAFFKVGKHPTPTVALSNVPEEERL